MTTTFSGSMGGHGSGVFSNKCFSVLHGTRLRHLFSFSLSLIAGPVTTHISALVCEALMQSRLDNGCSV